MPRLRFRITLRTVIVLVTLTALNLAGAIATSKYYRRKPPHVVSGSAGRGFVRYYSDGSVEFGRRHPLRYGERKPREEVTRVLNRRPLPTTLEVWSPVIASTSITLLVLIAGRAIGGSIRRMLARLTTRSAIVIILVALNVAGAVATFKRRPGKQLSARREGFGQTFIDRDVSGLTFFYTKATMAGYQLSGVLREPLPPTLLQIWAPVIASTSISLLVVLFPRPGSASAHRDTKTIVDGVALAPLPGRRLMARYVPIAVVLIGLNLAAVVSRPPPDRCELPLDYGRLFGGTPRTAAFEFDGRLVQRRLVDGADVLPSLLRGRVDRSNGDGYKMSEVVVNFRTDGGIVALIDSPMRASPHMRPLRPPTRSFFDSWSWVITSASITILVIALLWRGTRPG